VNRAWIPPAFFGAGIALLHMAGNPPAIPLRTPLAEAVPDRLFGYEARDATLDDEEVRLSGADTYLARLYVHPRDTTRWFSLYVGYYERQARGRTIHSPKNCLPGSGWVALESASLEVPTDEGPVRVNRYVVERRGARALVLYWYQGRGRVQASEYLVKWDLLRDATLRHRTEEALVRILLPYPSRDGDTARVAESVAAALISHLNRALPD
jgi:EpsI family protein